MTEERCCGKNVEIGQERAVEIVAIEKTANYCPMCEDYARREVSKPFVVMSCEGGCLRGEVARQAANMVCYDLLPESTARLCLGGAFTKDTGQRNLARSATKRGASLNMSRNIRKRSQENNGTFQLGFLGTSPTSI